MGLPHNLRGISGRYRSRVMRHAVGIWPLVMTIFFCVSGGPYGLETIVQSGRGMALALIVAVAIFWALPIALLSAELGSAIPEEGGYYEWVKRGVGPRAGFACAWLTFLYSCVDVAIYPVLFVNYLGALGLGGSHPLVSLITRVAMVVPLVWLNIRGIATTGRAALLFAVALLVPFLLMSVLGWLPTFANLGAATAPFTPSGMSTGSALGAGLFVILWNYLGWDSLSTVSREVKDAPRLFPKALMIAMPLVILVYFLPVFVGLNAVPDISKWTDGSWPMIAGTIGGPALRMAVGVGGLVSAAGLFAAGLLAASRIPFVLAADGYIPRTFTALHPKYSTPARAIITSAAIYLILSSFSFGELAEVDVLLYSSALLLEFWALIQLRRRRPELARPFKIPGGKPMVLAISLSAAILVTAAMLEMALTSWKEMAMLASFAAITGAALLRFRIRNRDPLAGSGQPLKVTTIDS